MRLIACLGALLMIGAPAFGQNVTLEGTLKSVSLFSLIGQACGQVSKVDVKRAQDYRDAFMDVAAKSFGQKPATDGLGPELKRRQQEVSAEGAGPWCRKQQNYLEGVGVKDVFVN
jgi:hypothetical protein